MTQPSVPGRVSCGPLEPPTLGRKSEMWQVTWGKDQDPSCWAGIQAGRICRGTLILYLRVLFMKGKVIKGTVRKAQSFIQVSCSTKGIYHLEDGSLRKPYGYVNRSAAQTQISLTSLVNFTQVEASPTVLSFSEEHKDFLSLHSTIST